MSPYLFWLYTKTLTLRKVFNAIKVFVSYKFSSWLKKPLRWGQPISISLEPVSFCNLRCPQCPAGNGSLTRKKSFINFNIAKSVIDQSYKQLVNLFLYFQGEPLLYPALCELIKYAKNKNIFCATSTNAQFIDIDKAKDLVKSGLDHIIISLDGADQKTYATYRIGGNIAKVLSSIENLEAAKRELKSKTPFVEVQFIVFKHNQHQIEQVKKLALSKGANLVSIKTAQIYADFETWLPDNKYSRYKKQNGNYVQKRKLKNRCWRLWNSIVVTVEGDILPCCYDKNAKYAFGNLKNETIKNVIGNHKFKKFASTLLHNQNSIDICNNCNG